MVNMSHFFSNVECRAVGSLGSTVCIRWAVLTTGYQRGDYMQNRLKPVVHFGAKNVVNEMSRKTKNCPHLLSSEITSKLESWRTEAHEQLSFPTSGTMPPTVPTACPF